MGHARHTTYATPAEVERVFFPALVAHGVLGIRDPASRFPAQQTARWRTSIRQGRLVAPRLQALGRVVDAQATTLGTVLVRSPQEAGRAIERLRREQYDFAKPYNDLSAAAYEALLQEAGRVQFTVAGHLPYAVDAAHAAALGQRSVEHLTNLWFEVARAEDAIRARIVDAIRRGSTPEAVFRLKIETLFPLAFDTHDADKEHALFTAFVKHGTWQVPTLIVDRYYARFATSPPPPSELSLLPRWVIDTGQPLAAFLASLTPAQRQTLGELYTREAGMVGRMHRAGVSLLAGSDAPLAYVVPGPSLHDELEAFVRDGGLSPLDALRTATLNAGRYFNDESLGTIAPGSPADLVLLDADPTTDIRHTRRIRAVVQSGRYLDRATLDTMIKAAELAGARR